VDVQRATEYSAEDADVTLRLHQSLYPKLAADEKLKRVYETIEMPVREVLFRMERTGVLVDAARLDAQSRELGQKMIELEQAPAARPGSRSTSTRRSRSARSSSSG
jgi:DNA polymerase-1